MLIVSGVIEFGHSYDFDSLDGRYVFENLVKRWLPDSRSRFHTDGVLGHKSSSSRLR